MFLAIHRSEAPGSGGCRLRDLNRMGGVAAWDQMLCRATQATLSAH